MASSGKPDAVSRIREIEGRADKNDRDPGSRTIVRRTETAETHTAHPDPLQIQHSQAMGLWVSATAKPTSKRMNEK